MVKQFKFPTFDEWVSKDCEYKGKVGDYWCEIGVFSYSTINGSRLFMGAISNDNFPLNVYVSKKAVYSSLILDSDTEKLELWYTTVVEDLNRDFESFIKLNYLLEG